MINPKVRKIFSHLLSTVPLPVIVFVYYGYHSGEPNYEQWVDAYRACAPIAVVHSFFLLALSYPINRIVLGGNIYLISGGVALIANQTWFLRALEVLQETGLMIAIVVLGAVSTYASQKGYVGVAGRSKTKIRFYSLLLLGASFVSMLLTIPFRGNPVLAGFLPFVGLLVLQRIFAARICTDGAVS